MLAQQVIRKLDNLCWTNATFKAYLIEKYTNEPNQLKPQKETHKHHNTQNTASLFKCPRHASFTKKTMAQYVYTLLSLAMSCSVRREISPCSCDVHPSSSNMIMLTCDGVDSFNRVFDALQNRFNPDLKIQLLVNRSQLEDMETKAFGDMNLRLKNLRLNFDNLK